MKWKLSPRSSSNETFLLRCELVFDLFILVQVDRLEKKPEKSNSLKMAFSSNESCWRTFEHLTTWPAVWPDVAKFRHLGKNSACQTNFNFIYCLVKFLGNLGDFCMLWAKVFRSNLAKFWKTLGQILPNSSGHNRTWLKIKGNQKCLQIRSTPSTCKFIFFWANINDILSHT